jgi:RHS repeat-associated protein
VHQQSNITSKVVRMFASVNSSRSDDSFPFDDGTEGVVAVTAMPRKQPRWPGAQLARTKRRGCGICNTVRCRGLWGSPQNLADLAAGTCTRCAKFGPECVLSSRTMLVYRLVRRRWRWDFRKPCRSRLRSRPPQNQPLPRNAQTCFEGPFGELIRATGPMAKANPFRFSTKYQDDETDLLYYGYRYYNASTGKWSSRDPAELYGGPNLYGFLGNAALRGIDILGLCKVCRTRVTYRGSISELDNEVYGMPYSMLAEAARRSLQTVEPYASLGITFPAFTAAGPFLQSSSKEGDFHGLKLPPGGAFAAHYLFFVEFDVDERDGRCSVGLTETSEFWRKYSDGAIKDHIGPKTNPESTPVTKNVLLRTPISGPRCGCDRRIIFVDAPGHWGMKRSAEVLGFGPYLRLRQDWRIRDRSRNIVLLEEKWPELGIGGDSDGRLLSDDLDSSLEISL